MELLHADHDLPTSICEYLDKLNINFSWGDLDNKKKVYLVMWKSGCKPKINTGVWALERAAKLNNLAINAN